MNEAQLLRNAGVLSLTQAAEQPTSPGAEVASEDVNAETASAEATAAFTAAAQLLMQGAYSDATPRDDIDPDDDEDDYDDPDEDDAPEAADVDDADDEFAVPATAQLSPADAADAFAAVDAADDQAAADDPAAAYIPDDFAPQRLRPPEELRVAVRKQLEYRLSHTAQVGMRREGQSPSNKNRKAAQGGKGKGKAKKDRPLTAIQRYRQSLTAIVLKELAPRFEAFGYERLILECGFPYLAVKQVQNGIRPPTALQLIHWAYISGTSLDEIVQKIGPQLPKPPMGVLNRPKSAGKYRMSCILQTLRILAMDIQARRRTPLRVGVPTNLLKRAIKHAEFRKDYTVPACRVTALLRMLIRDGFLVAQVDPLYTRRVYTLTDLGEEACLREDTQQYKPLNPQELTLEAIT